MKANRPYEPKVKRSNLTARFAAGTLTMCMAVNGLLTPMSATVGFAPINVSAVSTGTSSSVIDVQEMLCMGEMEADFLYSGSLYNGEPTDRTMQIIIEETKSIAIDAELDAGHGTLKLMLTNESGKVLASASGTKAFTLTADNLTKGTYYLVIDSSSVTNLSADYSLRLHDKGSVSVDDITPKASWKNDPTKPEYSFSYGGKELKENTDYKIISITPDSTNQSDGSILYSYAVTIQGIGNFYGKKTFKFTNTYRPEDAAKKKLSDCTITARINSNNDIVYTLKYGSITLKEGVDFTVSTKTTDTVKDGITYRSYESTLKGIGEYTGSLLYRYNDHKIASSTAGKTDITTCNITAAFKSDPVENGADALSITVKNGSVVLKEGTDYTKTVKLESKTQDGEYTVYKYLVTISGKGNYVNSGTWRFTGRVRDIIELDFSDVTIPDRTYTGEQICPKITGLTEGVDYTATYGENVNVGVGTVKITGKGKYKGSATLTFNILPRQLSVSGTAASQVYSGKALSPIRNLSIKSSGIKLTYGKDFKVTYTNNTNVGTATAKITFINNYKGGGTMQFKITPKSLNSSGISAVLANDSFAYSGNAIKPAVVVTNGSVILKNGTDYTVSYSNNIAVGTATVTIKGKGNYSGSINKSFKIVSKSKGINTCSITLSGTSFVYNGSAKKPSVTIKNGSTTLTQGKDYTVKYSNNTQIGTATVTIEGIGNYSGIVTKSFHIMPQKQKLISLKPKSNGFTFQINKDTAVTGYQIMYSTTSTFSSATTKAIKNNNTVLATLINLKHNTKYYVKVRSYKTITSKTSATTYYGQWSDVKTVVTE